MTAIEARVAAGRRRGRARARAIAYHGLRVTNVQSWLARGIELAWLLALIVTPLIVLPEQEFLSRTELPKVATVRIAAGLALVLMLVDVGIGLWWGQSRIPRLRAVSFTAWLKRGESPLVPASVVLLVVTTAASAAFALVPRLGVWGADPGGESNSFYATAAYAALFFAVSTRLRTRPQAYRLMGAIVLSGTLAAVIGVAQHFGYAPFDIRSTSGSTRVSGTAGNPIFFAAILAVTLSMAMGMSLMAWDAVRARWGWLLGYGAVASIQLTALLITLSRGPWLGAAAGLITVLAFAPIVFGWRRVVTSGAVTAAALLVALAFIGATDGFANPTAQAASPVTSSSAGGPSAPADTIRDVQDRVSSLSGVFDPEMNARLARWDGALELAFERPAPPVGADPGRLVRSLLGYGPDTFPDVLPIVAPARLANVRSPAAHNDPLNRLVETGLLGLLAWGALLLSLAYLVAGSVWRNRGHGTTEQALTIAAGAALAAWFASSLTGIPRSGDSVLFWVIAGLAVAAPRAFAAEAVDVAETRNTCATSVTRGRIVTAAALALAAVAVAWVTWTGSVQRIRADASAAEAVSSVGRPFAARLEDIEQAISLASGVPRYHAIRSDLYLELSTAAAPDGPPDALREASASAGRALALNPLDRDLNFRAAFVDWELAQSGDVDAALRTLAAYQRLAGLTPQHPDVAPRLAAVRDALGFAP